MLKLIGAAVVVFGGLSGVAALHGPAYAAGVVTAVLSVVVVLGVALGLLYAVASYGREAVRAWGLW